MTFKEVYEQTKDIPGWLGEPDSKVLYDYASKIENGLIVEIGSYSGKSTKILALASPSSRVITIDSFVLGNPDIIKKQFHESVEGLNVTLLEMDSKDVGADWSEPIDLLVVDGDHSYEAVKQDIDLFAPHVLAGKFSLFHDYTITEKGYGVDEAVDELSEDYFSLVKVVSGFAVCRRKK